MRICVDAGHGGDDPGAISHGVAEKDVTGDIATVVGFELRALGHRAYLTRFGDRTLSLAARARHANRHDCDRFVSVHANAALTAQAEGIETWFYPGSVKGQKLAASVQAALLQATPGAKDRGIKEGNFAVLRLTNMPAVLVELGFITNAKERRRLTDAHWQEEAARAIARGVVEARL